MNLTQREKTILELASQGIIDYKIARRIYSEPQKITRSKKNDLRKLTQANSDLKWA